MSFPLGDLVEAIVSSEPLQELWHVKDRGMPVFAHTIDVTMLCLSDYPEWQERFPEMSLPAVTIASLLHDLNKLSTHRTNDASHSLVMRTDPGQAIVEAVEVLQRAQWQTGVSLSEAEVDHIWHIVVSHHGRWGKIQPHTPEAALVHQCDFHSATEHRLTPIDASDILPLLSEGLRWREIAARLGVTSSVIRDRLREATKAEGVADAPALLAIWQKRGYVVAGTLQRVRQVEETRVVIEEAHQAPANLVLRLGNLVKDHAAKARGGQTKS